MSVHQRAHEVNAWFLHLEIWLWGRRVDNEGSAFGRDRTPEVRKM